MMFDVAIVGAGPVGCSLACALAESGLRCALIDSSAPGPESDAWDSRVYALSPATQSFLERLGAWQALDPARVAPVRRMQIFGDARGSRLAFSAYDAGVDRLATIAESGRLQRALWQALRDQPGLSIYCPGRPASLAVNADAADITLESGERLAARLLVGADGQHSWVRTAAGIRSVLEPLHQTAVVANFTCSAPHRETAYQWFGQDGVLAWLPLPGNRFSMVWSTQEGYAQALLRMDPAELCARVAEAGEYALGDLEIITPPAAFPLVRLSVPRRVRPRIALIGDAAQVIHPLAGQGVNLGFGDAEALARRLVDGTGRGDGGEWLSLRGFERERAEDILAMRMATTGLQTLFQASWPGLSQLRNWGLNLTERLPVVKNLLARRAMGGAKPGHY